MKKISINYRETNYFKLELEIDLEVLKQCSPPYIGNTFEEFKKYMWSNVYDGMDNISVNEDWLDQNEAILKKTKISGGRSMYDELEIFDLELSSMEKYDFFHSDRMLRKNPRAMIDKFIL